MAWFIASGANHVFNCNKCTDIEAKSRNCKGEHETRFQFQIKQIKSKDDLHNAFINECPAGYITDFSMGLWSKYQDQKIKNELGIITNDLPAIYFEAFKYFIFALQDYDEWKSKKAEKEQKRKIANG